MAQADLKEKRLFQRFPCFLYGNFKYGNDRPGYAIFQNLSAFGAEFKTYDSLPQGQELDFNVMTRNMIPFVFGGKVRWCRKDGKFWHVGISFNKPMFVPLRQIA